jgi:uncharacterized protein YcnI
MKLSRLCAVGGASVIAVVGLSAPAFAHVTVAPEGEATKGGETVLDFKVPNERDNASTTEVEVNFPVDQHPLATVQPEAVPGWTAKITKTKLAKPVTSDDGAVREAVSKVTWTADGKGIEPGFFQKFPVLVGPLPQDADQLAFKTLQTYSDHEIVRWIEIQQPGESEPENPAPVLKLTSASAQQDQGAARANSGSTAPPASPAAKTSVASSDKGSGGSDTTARVLGVLGIVIGAAGVAFGFLAGRRRTTN